MFTSKAIALNYKSYCVFIRNIW